MIKARFLVDESVGKKFANVLKSAGVDVLFGGDVMPEVADEAVLSFAKLENRILITADKDFGELVFKLKMSVRGVIFLRTSARDPEERFELVKDVLDKSEGKFIVIKEGHIRVRGLK